MVAGIFFWCAMQREEAKNLVILRVVAGPTPAMMAVRYGLGGFCDYAQNDRIMEPVTRTSTSADPTPAVRRAAG
jgi:hypothetical protein